MARFQNRGCSRLRMERLERRDLCAADWCNPANPLDVDQSGQVVALDVLQVVNEINQGGMRSLGAKAANYTGPLFDVNGDGGLSGLDVLEIVNALNRFSMPMSLNVSETPTGERVILPSGMVRTNLIYEGVTLADSKVKLEQIDVTAAPLILETLADANGNFHFQFDTSGAALNLRITSVDRLGRSQSQVVALPATDAPSPELVARIADQAMPTVGQMAPELSLQDQDGNTVNLRDVLANNSVVLYFYPKDDTPGCTTEAQDFRDRLSEIEALGAKVIGISLDSVESHKTFSDKFQLNFPLLADPSFNTAQDYGVLSEYSGVAIAKRTTFIIGTDGQIQKIFLNVQVANHVQEVIDALSA